jgi:hypothetical protein
MNGAAEGIRTPDPRITNALLYQLSYRGILKAGLLLILGMAKRKGSCRSAAVRIRKPRQVETVAASR